MNWKRGRQLILRIAFCLLACAMAVSAQFNASVQGTVLDPNGASVAGAKITAKNLETGKTYEATSNEEGFYRITGLPPGKYSVLVEAAGFKKREEKSVEVEAERTRGLDLKLELGPMEQTVTVTAEAVPLQTESSNVQGTISTLQVQRLPQVGRDPYELLRLAPGVFGDLARGGDGSSSGFPNGPPNSGGTGGSNASIFATENQPALSANGQRVGANNFTIDGVSVNSLTWGGAAVVTPSQEAVKEVTVTSSAYSAEYGRNSGAQVQVVTKNGSNDFHGSLFYKHDDPGLNAFNKFPGSQKRVLNKLRQYGGSIGGPILKDKLFFFFNYERLHTRNREQLDEFVETTDWRNTVIAARPGTVSANVLNSTGIAPRVVTVLPVSGYTTTPTGTLCDAFTSLSPSIPCAVVGNGIDIGSPGLTYGTYIPTFNPATALPNGGGLDGLADLQLATIEVPHNSDGNQFTGRADWIWGRNQFFFSTVMTKFTRLNGDSSAQGRPQADIRSKPFNPAATIGWTRTLSTTMLNELRFNFTRFAFNEVKTNPNTNFGLPRIEIEGLPLFSFNGQTDRIRFGAPRAETTPGVFATNTLSLRDVVSKVWGRHGLKAGIDHTWEQDNNNLLGGARPLYSFRQLWNFANGTPIFESINFDPATGKPQDAQRYFRTRDLGLFVQDDFKFRPNLTFNIGLRYEYYTPLREKNGRITNLVLGPAGSELTGARIDIRDQLFEPDRNNFAPRLGLAWSPDFWGLRDKFVIRAGYGVAYNRIHNGLFANSRGNPPLFGRGNFCCGTAGSAVDFFGDPFALGTIFYTQGTSNSVNSYPANPNIIFGIDPATNLPLTCCFELYGTPNRMPNAYVHLWSLDTDYELPWHFIFSLGYQGSSSHKLVRIVNQNFIFAPPAGPSPVLDPIFFITPDVNANFNALDLRLTRRYAQGFQFTVDYRWSKSIDTLSNDGPGFLTNQTFPIDNSTERGPSDYDATHSVRFFGVWDLPIFRHRTDLLGRLLGGWHIDGVYQFHSGFPWTAVNDNCLQLPSTKFLCPIRPLAYFGGAGDSADTSTFLSNNGNFPGISFAPCPARGTPYFDVCTPTTPTTRPGIGRNTFRGPRFTNVDLTFGKTTKLGSLPFFGENAALDFKANFFNAFNKLNLTPFAFASSSTKIQSTTFGQASSGLSGRVIEFQMRFSF